MKKNHGFSGTGTSLNNDILFKISIDYPVLVFLNRNKNIGQIMLTLPHVQHTNQERIGNAALKDNVFIGAQIHISIQKSILDIKLPCQLDIILTAIFTDLDGPIVDQIMSKVAVGRNHLLSAIKKYICGSDVIGL